MDLFGRKPKVSKVLATSKMEKPIYPYQINEITVNGSLVTFSNKLSADVSFEDDMYYITYPSLNLEIWGETREEAEEAFDFALKVIIKNIYFENDSNLTEKSILLKQRLRTIIKSR